MHAAIAIPTRFSGRQRGFTLIELMLAVVVLGILTAVALPSFLDSIRKGRRSEAFAAIASLQQAQERWRSNNPTYSNSLSQLVIQSPTRPGSYYTLTIDNATATGYEATANGTASSQAGDGACAKLSVKVDRNDISYASCATCSSYTYAATDPCWKR